MRTDCVGVDTTMVQVPPSQSLVSPEDPDLDEFLRHSQKRLQTYDDDAITINDESSARLDFDPVSMNWHSMKPSISTTLNDESECVDDFYQGSSVERRWKENANAWTVGQKMLCLNLKDTLGRGWNDQITGKTSARTTFSKLCKKSEKPQILEPLVGLLRSPRFLCGAAWNPSKDFAHLMDVDFLVLADSNSANLASDAKRIFFYAGGTVFQHAMSWFAEAYAERGIEFDHIYVWEANEVPKEKYWAGTSAAQRAKWEPRLTFYSGTYATADPNDVENNVLERIKKECRREDFCAFKLDIDTPSVELALVQQLRDSKEAQAKIDEFFFEHHITNKIMSYFWGSPPNTNGTFQDSYELFTDLRNKGVRAHSWV